MGRSGNDSSISYCGSHSVEERRTALRPIDYGIATRRSLLVVLKQNWILYVFEGIELAIFMISACAFTVLLFDPSHAAMRIVPSAGVRRLLMGIAMGLTAIFIIHSPMGKRSGAHFNPAISLTYFLLGKMVKWDAAFYILFQFLGGILGVGIAALFLWNSISTPQVDYAVTVPGPAGTAAAFLAEFLWLHF